MHLHVDGIVFSLQRHGGITVYFRELLKRFQPEHGAILTLEEPGQQSFDLKDMPHVDRVSRSARRGERLRRCRTAGLPPAHVFHSSYYRRPERRDIASVVTVHDFVYQRFVTGPRGWLRRWLMNTAILEAQHIICISESTRQDLLEFVPIRADQKVSVIHNGVSKLFHPLADQGATNVRPYVLFVGQRAGYKNFSLALGALAHLPGIELHCVGGGALRDSEFNGISSEVRRRVKHLGFVTDEQLNEHYNRALCLLYPSAYEGFGIPVLEAMRAGCPVVSVDCKAVREVGGEALSVVHDSRDSMAAARAVMDSCEPQVRGRLRDHGFARSQMFGWDRCFEETMAVYSNI